MAVEGASNAGEDFSELSLDDLIRLKQQQIAELNKLIARKEAEMSKS